MWTQALSAPPRAADGWVSWTSPWTLGVGPLRWRETGDAFFLEGELPGFRRKDVSVEVRDRTLEVTATRERGFRAKERHAFRELVTLPAGADPGTVEAHHHGEHLSIRVAKTAAARRRIIPIRVHGELPPSVRSDSERPARSWLASLRDRVLGSLAPGTARSR